MAKSKKKSVVEFLKKHAKKKARKPVSNPRSMIGGVAMKQAKELAGTVGPAFAAYVVARIVSRVAKNVVGSRVPFLAKHASPAANLALLVGAGWGAGKVKILRRFQTEILVGLAFSTLQTLLKAYAPGLGRLLEDSPAAPSRTDALAGVGSSVETLQGGPEADMADSEMTWSDPQLSKSYADGESDADLYTGPFAR